MVRVKSPALTVYLVVLMATGAGCGKGSKSSTNNSAQNVVAPKSDTNGVTTTTVDPKATTPQTIQASASGAVKGSAITLPVGALGVATDITVQEGASLATNANSQSLGIAAGTVTAAGPATIFTASTAQNATTPFTIAIALSGAALDLTDATLAVVYKAVDADKNALLLGVIPSTSLTVSGTTVTFSTTHFGVFQAVHTTTPVTAAKEVPTQASIVPKVSLTGNPFIGIWESPCAAQPAPAGQTPNYQIMDLYANDSETSFVVSVYSDAGCKTLGAIFSLRLKFAVTGDSTAVPGAKETTSTVISSSAEPKSQTVTDELNQSKQCGYSDWAIDAIKDLTGATATPCDPFHDAAGTTFYDIAEVVGDTFKPSGGNGGATPAERPTALDTDPNHWFTRQ